MSKFLLTNGMKIGKATVIVDIIPKGNTEIRPGTKMVPQFLTKHNTGNTGKGANAEAHNKLIHNMAKKSPRDTSHVSWHLTVDENFIYQHIPFDEIAWHCGDGMGKGNMQSIGTEICMHSDQKNYAQAEENAVVLGAYLMKQFNIPIKNVHPHQYWSGKFCPAVILKRDGTFGKFRARIDAAYQLANAKPVVKPVAPVVKPVAKPKEENEVLLNDTGRQSARRIIKKAVADKIFMSKHENVDKYDDKDLISYAFVALEHRTK